MGYAIYEMDGRDCGYGVPCTCEHPGCRKKIDRGLSYVCGDLPGDNEQGCGLYFCGDHMFYGEMWGGQEGSVQLCERCLTNHELGEDAWEKHLPAFGKKPDHPEWIRWKLKHASWQEWRDSHQEEVKQMRQLLKP